MKRLSIILTVLALSVQIFAQSILVKNVTVVDVRNGRLLAKRDLLIEGNKIKVIGKGLKANASAIIIDGSNKYIIPGFWDMHAHSFTDRKFEWLFPLLIANGVTGVRDMATTLPYDSIHLIKKQIAEGTLLGPRFGATTQRILDGPDGASIPSVAVTTPDEGREYVRMHKQNGVDFIKVYNFLSREVFFAIMDEAKKQKIPVAGHVPFSMSALEVSDLGQVSIEHNTDLFFSCSSEEANLRQELEKIPKPAPPVLRQPLDLKAIATLDEKKRSDLFRRFVKNGTWNCPTLVVMSRFLKKDEEMAVDDRLKYLPQRFRQPWSNQIKQRDRISTLDSNMRKMFFEKNLEIVGLMHRAGVGILAGSDMMNPYIFPGFSLHDELGFLVQAGLSPLDALRTATINAAKFLHKEKEIGTVEAGRYADLVLLDANPIENISNTKKIFVVIANGKVFQRADLNKLLMQVEELVKK